MICLLDARQIPSIRDFIHQIKQVKSSAGDEGVLFLLSFPVERIELWKKVLVKSFSEEQGYENVAHYYVEKEDGTLLGQAVMTLGGINANAILSHVDFIEAPPAIGCCKFGVSMIYVELRFSKALSPAIAEFVGIIWEPDLFCVDKYCFNDANFWGAMGFMTASMVCRRHGTLCEDASSRFEDALDVLRAHLGGIIVLADMRSEYFTDTYPVHMMKMSGNAHAVEGTLVNGEFRDSYAHPTLRCIPVCYKVRNVCYSVVNHSFDFWAPHFFSSSGDEDFSSSGDKDWMMVGNEGTILNHANSESRARGSAVSTLELSSTPVGWAAPVVEDEAEAACMVCLERPPTIVFEKCGHLGVCGKCRKYLCKEEFNKNKSHTNQVSPALLSMKKVAKLQTKCPYCRTETRSLHCSQYTGTVHKV